jgi:hypothetical protein
MLDTHRRRRPLRVLAYGLLAGGATIILTDPTKSFEHVPGQLRFFWNSMLLVGCVLTCFGAFRDRYLFEFVGIPLALAGIAAFIVVLAVAGTTGPLAFACFLAAIFVIIFSRGLDVWDLVNATRRAERRRQ